MNITEPSFNENEIRLVRQCLDSKWVTQGPMVAEFERLFAQRHQVAHAAATTSCTAGLHLAALALKLGPGDEVIVPAFTWVTSAHCAEYVGARAVFADIDLATYNLDPAAVEAAITPRSKAIVAVHLFGLPAPMDELLQLARKHGLAIIEDAACAVGVTYKGRAVGAIGDIASFSFHPRKVITTGEGGMVTTDRDDLAQLVMSLRNHGATGVDASNLEPHGPWTMTTFNNLGFNLRLSDIQAAVGIAQMGKLDGLLAERRELAGRYSEMFADFDDEVVLPGSAGEAEGHSFQSYVIRIRRGGRERRNAIMYVLAERGIQTRPGTHAAHRLGYYRDKYGLRPEAFPNAATAEDTTITLPVFPGMTQADQIQVKNGLLQGLTSK
jgi:dTDP-4-amino-4,6-dideoxygalactose transaminase